MSPLLTCTSTLGPVKSNAGLSAHNADRARKQKQEQRQTAAHDSIVRSLRTESKQAGQSRLATGTLRGFAGANFSAGCGSALLSIL